MGWDDGNNNDPWRSRGNKGPADLDQIVRDLQRKISGLFGGGRGEDGGAPGGGQVPKVGSGIVSFVVVVIVGLWAATGFYMVDAAERGIVLRFGEFREPVTQPGLNWHLPFPIESVVKINTEQVVRWPYQGSMLTRDENIVVVNLVVQYRRTDPVRYLFSMRDPEETLQDVTASAIREIVGKNDLNYILTEGRLDISSRAQELLQATLDAYDTGITVYEVNMQEAQFPEEVQASVQDVVKAREDQARVILEAETYRNQLIPNARGQAVRQRQNAEAYKAQVVNNAEGESNRFLQILHEYQIEPEVTRERIYLETLQEILANSTKVLVDTQGGNNLLYLPLDQLVQRGDGSGRQAPVTQFAPGSSSSPSSSSATTSTDRSRR